MCPFLSPTPPTHTHPSHPLALSESRHDCSGCSWLLLSRDSGFRLGNLQPLPTPACPWFLGRQHQPARVCLTCLVFGNPEEEVA